MSDTADLLRCYETIATLTERMLAAARDDNWDDLDTLEQQYRAQVEHIKHLDTKTPLDDANRARKHAIIRRILADDAAIRDLMVPHLAHLDSLISSAQRQRALHQAYGHNRGL